MARRWVSLVAAFLLQVLMSSLSLAQPSAPLPQEPALAELHGEWLWVLTAYGANPARYRRQLLSLGEDGVDDFPTPVVLALADARLRGGSPDAARDLCDLVVQRNPGEPWLGWATLCSAWAGIALGDRDRAVSQLEALVRSGSQSGPVGELVLALVESVDERLEEAHYRFARVASSGSDDLRAAGRFSLGLVRFWKHEYAPAIQELRQMVVEMPNGYFTDDARYVAARAELAQGDQDRAIGEIRALAALRPRAVRFRDAAALVDLDPSALLHAAFERYRRGRARLPEAQVAFSLNSDGGALARAFLRGRGEWPAPSASEAGAATPIVDRVALPGNTAAPRPDGARPAGQSWAPSGACVAFVALGIAGLVLWRRRHPHAR